ncbi:MAG: hypothetical protein JY451_11040 [Erythrobacter sp.]|nr:MAG: hypothetical protein JY451_11040 [Erythrobacter sp.]
MKHPASALAVLTLALAACYDPVPDSPAEPPDVPTQAGGGVVAQPPVGTADPEGEAGIGQEEALAQAGAVQDSIPARFHGRWAESAAACGGRNHQQYHIEAAQVGFFESVGEVQQVRAQGDYAAATLSEQYADDSPAVYVFYMALDGADAMRVRYDNEPRIGLVRCPRV